PLPRGQALKSLHWSDFAFGTVRSPARGRESWNRSCRLRDSRGSGEEQMDAAVLGAFFLDLAELQRADFGGVGDVGAAAGLEVDLADADQADATLAGGRLHLHGLDEAGVGGHFGVGDPLL